MSIPAERHDEARALATRLDLDELRSQVNGHVVAPGDGEYDECREVWNAMIERYPAVIVRAQTAQDVVRALEFGRSRAVPVAVRAGGHSVAGNSVCDGGIVIDLRAMREVRVDPQARQATVGGGALLRDADAATQRHGLAVPAGVVSHTGVAGLALGGGMGWLTRKCGLTCDNLLEAEVVTPSAGLITADRDANSDLLWGLCGGGGNFGIVTRFRFQAHAVGPVVPVGAGIWPVDVALDVLRRYREVMPQAQDDLRALVEFRVGAARPELGAHHAKTPIIAISAIWTGRPERAEEVFRPLLAVEGALARDTLEMQFTELQKIDDDSQGHGANNYTRGGYLDSLDDETIEALADACRDMTSAESMIELGYQHGAQDLVAERDSAFANRTANYYLNVYARWPLAAEHQPHIDWTRSTFDSLAQWRRAGVYTNFLNADDQNERIAEAYGAYAMRRLGALKDRYDPENLLHLNQNIPPTRSGSRDQSIPEGSQR